MAKRKRTLILVSLAAVSVAGGTWLRVRGDRTAAASRGRQGNSQTLPFTVTRSDVTFAPGEPAPVRTEMRTIAVRSDGSNVELFHRRDPSGSGKVVYIRDILDVPGRQKIVVDPVSESLITYPLGDTAVEVHAIKPVAQCVGIAAGQMLGYDVTVEETSPEPQDLGPRYDERRIRAWRALRLDCLPLRREITFFKGGREVLHIIEAVVTVVEGEPDESLFEIPKGYVERPPSEAMGEAARRYPNDKDWQCGKCSQSQSKKDDIYFHRWKERGQQK